MEDIDKQFRRVSIQCNGEPLPDDEQDMPVSMDRNIIGLDESMLLTPSYRYGRRTSCMRKQIDIDTFGAFLYPPSPHFSYKRGRRTSVSRRHSDSLLPTLHDPYYVDRLVTINLSHIQLASNNSYRATLSIPQCFDEKQQSSCMSTK